MRYCVWVVAYYAPYVVRTDADQPPCASDVKSTAPCVYYDGYFEKYIKYVYSEKKQQQRCAHVKRRRKLLI
jgi:hypothetical protein